MAGIFVSYARKDIKQVRRILREIHALGFDYWMDTRNIQSGDIWPEEITNAILDCKKFLLFMSAASMASDNVQREIQIAYENKKKIIILRLENVEIPKSLKYQLARIQWTEYSAPDWKTRIAIALRSRSKPAAPKKPPTSSLQLKTKMDGILQAQKIASELETVFSSGASFYQDQCTTILARIDGLHNLINNHWAKTSTVYQRLMPRMHLLEKVNAINDLVMEFRDTCPPGSQVKRRAIQRELKSLLDDLNHEMKT